MSTLHLYLGGELRLAMYFQTFHLQWAGRFLEPYGGMIVHLPLEHMGMRCCMIGDSGIGIERSEVVVAVAIEVPLVYDSACRYFCGSRLCVALVILDFYMMIR